jgi:CheY-like chemotaxis protein
MKRRKVLIVDDEAVLREAVSAVVGQFHDVATAADGREALAAVANVRPDVVILDVMMAHLSEGFDVARALRSDPATAAIRIIMLTGVDEVYDVRQQVGSDWPVCDRYIAKPPEPRELLAAIKELTVTAD